MASWLSETQAKGKTVKHTDGTRGTVLDVVGSVANVEWEDGTISTEHEDYLTYTD